MDELTLRVEQTPGKISCNFEEIEAALKRQMEAYEGLEVTEDNIPERKKDVATLRKIMTAIEDRRKAVKKEFQKPYDEFEAGEHRLVKVIAGAIGGITKQLNEFEAERKRKKSLAIVGLYESEIGELKEFLPLSAIAQERWTNKTCSDNEIIGDIQAAKLQVKNDLDAIKGLGSEIEEKLIEAYKSSGNNLSAAIRKNTDYMEAKRAAEEQLRIEAERKAMEAEILKNAEELRRRDEERAPEIQSDTPEILARSERAMETASQTMVEPTLAIRVRGAENIEALRNFLELSEMEYEEV